MADERRPHGEVGHWKLDSVPTPGSIAARSRWDQCSEAVSAAIPSVEL